MTSQRIMKSEKAVSDYVWGGAMSECTGLMGFWANIAPPNRERYRAWHNCEHMPERVGIPGFRNGRRYAAMGGGYDFFMMYETDGPEVLASQPYLDALNHPTDWTRESLTYFRDPLRNIYRLLADHGATDFMRAPCLATARFNAGGADPAKTDWAAQRAEWQAARIRLYARDEAISGIQTSERKIYRSGGAAQQYLLMVEAGLAAMAASSGLDVKIREKAESAHSDVFVDAFGVDYVLVKNGS